MTPAMKNKKARHKRLANFLIIIVARSGIEPETSWLWIMRSNQLSYLAMLSTIRIRTSCLCPTDKGATGWSPRKRGANIVFNFFFKKNHPESSLRHPSANICGKDLPARIQDLPFGSLTGQTGQYIHMKLAYHLFFYYIAENQFCWESGR